MAKKRTERLECDKEDLQTLRKSDFIKELIEDSKADGNGDCFEDTETASLWLAQQIYAVKNEACDKEFPIFSALKYFPITNECNENTETIYYYQAGESDSDLPKTGFNVAPCMAEVQAVGSSYWYSVDEVLFAYRERRGLNARKAIAAKQQIERVINKTAWGGCSQFMGILSQGTSIPHFEFSKNDEGSTKWCNKSGDEIIEEVGCMIKAVTEATNGCESPDTLLLPVDVFIYISVHRMRSKDVMVADAIKAQYPQIKTIDGAEELGDSSTSTNPWADEFGEGKGVAILYSRNPSKLSLEIPMSFKQHPVSLKKDEKGKNYLGVLCEAKTAGVLTYYPKSAILAVGV